MLIDRTRLKLGRGIFFGLTIPLIVMIASTGGCGGDRKEEHAISASTSKGESFKKDRSFAPISEFKREIPVEIPPDGRNPSGDLPAVRELNAVDATDLQDGWA